VPLSQSNIIFLIPAAEQSGKVTGKTMATKFVINITNATVFHYRTTFPFLIEYTSPQQITDTFDGNKKHCMLATVYVRTTHAVQFLTSLQNSLNALTNNDQSICSLQTASNKLQQKI